MIIFELPTDIASKILGEYLSQKGLVQLDNAICCKQREKYLQLLKLVLFFPQFVVSGGSADWILARQVKLLSANVRSEAVDTIVASTMMLPSLRYLFLSIDIQYDIVDLVLWLSAISNNCPRIQTLKLERIGETIVCNISLTNMLTHCLELKHFHALRILFPPGAWKALCDRQVSFLLVAETSPRARELLGEMVQLPIAHIRLVKEGIPWYNCIWNKMLFPDVNAAISTFFHPQRIMTAAYSNLCRGPHFTMFDGAFCALEFLVLSLPGRTNIYHDLATTILIQD